MKERYQNNQTSREVNEVLRPFASGSRQAPDPYDLFLDEINYYRKHTARDGSSLFRVISEQIYGIQNYHERVRKECVDYMTLNSHIFEKEIKNLGEDFDNYLMDMSKPKCRGGRIELKAAGFLYKANVMIFEPYMRGRYLFKYKKQFKRVIRVFFTPPSHYDSVYTKSYIEKAAYCQSIVYEILYEKLFKLPDVKYAVERMLHDTLGKTIKTLTKDGKEKAITEDGREFQFDQAEGTHCVLGDYKLCHFHNTDGFKAEIEKTNIIKSNANSLIEPELLRKSLRMDYFLHDKDISCVRQLLNEGIAPFPYKVAKALDPSIYRNIEFDSWADWRRELKFKNWYCQDTQFLVGCKCLVRRFDAKGDYFNICVIQEIPKDNKNDCLVFVEDTGEKLIVPYTSLKPLPSLIYPRDGSKNYNNVPNLQSNRYFSYNNKNNQFVKSSYKHQEISHLTTYKSEDYCSTIKCDIAIDQVSKNYQEFIVMPQYMIHNKRKPDDLDKGEVVKQEEKPQICVRAKEGESHEHYFTFLQETTVTSDSPDLLNKKINMISPGNSFTNLNSGSALTTTKSSSDLNVDYSAGKSKMTDGSDLPMADIPTLRFFYNLGIESFKHSKAVVHITSQLPSLSASEHVVPSPVTPQAEMNQFVKSFEKLKTDDNNNGQSPLVAAPLARTHSNLSTSSSQYHEQQSGRRSFKGRSYHNNNNRNHHAGNHNQNNTYRNNRYQQNRSGNGGSFNGQDFNNRHNNDNNYQFKGSTTPTSITSQHSSVHDSGIGDNHVNVNDSSQVSSDYASTPVHAQQYQYQQNEYDQCSNYCVPASYAYYYTQPSSVPATPQVMIPAPDPNAYIYAPNSAPVETNQHMVDPMYHQYMQPYYYPAPVQQPMGYFYYPSSAPLGYNNPGTAATSPQVAPLVATMSGTNNVQPHQ
uniref:CSON010375 protein n=1 Tax=Culicoides sonorensis TaxID=179676 RepID=A0A336LLU1_CULSO